METYHDYVIKDGKFIGKFDEMYAKFEDPWMQSAQPNKYARMIGITHLKDLGVKTVLECGCGLGYYANWIHRETKIVPKSIDISSTAIGKAKERFPHLDFEVANICTDLERYKDAECVIFAEVIWYILPDLDKVIESLRTHFKNKYLIVNQVFYKGTQQYGNDYFTDLKGFVRYMPFDLLWQCEATAEHESTIETTTLFRIK